MKKILSLLLAVAMLATCFTLGATAATGRFEGVVYTKVETEADLIAALSAGGNILLMNDLELTTSFRSATAVKPGTVINGNGHTLTYAANRSVPLFRFSAGTEVGVGTIEFRNINFGTKDVPMTVSGNVGLFVAAAANTSLLEFNNVNFYVVRTGVKANSGALFQKADTVMNFNGCNLDVTMTDVTGGTLHGGWFGEVASKLKMNNCTTRGEIAAPDTVGGIFGQSASDADVDLQNCINFASVTAPARAGGFVGNVGSGTNSMYFTNCTNYGNITSTGDTYFSMAGGLIACMTNKMETERLRVVYDCINYGTITSGNRAGGLVGSSHDYDYAKNPYYTFLGCINFGDVNGAQYAGGLMGISSPLTYKLEISECANLGKITSSMGYAGQFGGMLSAVKAENVRITDSYAAGLVSAAEGKTGVLAGCTTGTYTVQDGELLGQKKAVTMPVTERVTRVSTENREEALVGMSEMFGIRFVAADSDNSDALIVAGDPAIRGVQLSAVSGDSTTSIRFAATVNAKEPYSAFGFNVTWTAADGTSETKKITTYRLYESVNEKIGDSVTAITTEAEYLFMGVLKNIPKDQRILVQITPFALDKDGKIEYNGSAKLVAVENGMIDQGDFILNGYALRDYGIVYASSNKLSEKLLAQRLSDEIAKLTGISIPVYSQTTKNTHKAEILIGETNRATEYPDGRAVYALDSTKIVIKGDTTAELSEAHTYFLDIIEEKVLAGDFVWDITEPLTVPVDTEISLMAYNMGAKNKDAIKSHEWDLIVDYLPDVITFQEPWAGFLDDFLNDYAVQPEEKFVANKSDDDVMDTVYDGTGNGYYGVYWGLPRWKPGDATEGTGKASYSVILYAKDRFTVDASKSGTFWLSDTPDVSGSKFEDSKHVRCVTYATLTDKNTGESFVVVNAHLQGAMAKEQIEVMLPGLQARVDASLPIFITGDMNSEAGTVAMEYYFNNETMPMTSLDKLAKKAYRDERNIDWMMTNNPDLVDVSYYKYCGEWTFLNNLWHDDMTVGKPSDHPAVYAEFTINTKAAS